MKRLPILLVLIIALFSSCQKKQCWVCNQHEQNLKTGYDTIKTYTMCDMTKKEVRKYEKDIAGTDWYDVNGGELSKHVSCE